MRTIIKTIRLIPQDGALGIELVGELAGILALSNEKSPGWRAGGSTGNAGCGGRIRTCGVQVVSLIVNRRVRREHDIAMSWLGKPLM